jgi:hypothetical protein
MKPSDTVNKLLNEEGPEGDANKGRRSRQLSRRGRIMTVSISLDGTELEGIDIVMTPNAETSDRFNLAQALKNAAAKVCARPEFAKVITDVTGFS